MRACKRIRLVVSDVDGVLVPIRSSWGYVHEQLGTVEESRRNMELFRRGLIGYWEWMYLDTLAWLEARPGLTRWELERLFSKVPVLEEAKKAVRLLQSHGIDVVLVSGGIDVFVERVARELGVREWYANRLVFDAWGRLVPGGYPVVEGDRKDRLVKRIMREHGVSPRETAFLGDSLWDLNGMRESCLAIGVSASEELRQRVDLVARDALEAAKMIVQLVADA